MNTVTHPFVRTAAAAALAAILNIGGAHAADLGLSADVGTTGTGLHLSVPVTQNIAARVGFGLFDYSRNLSTSSVNYDATLKMQSIDLLADYFPFGESGFRLTGGAILNYNKIDATARAPSGTYTVNGNTYNASTAGTVNGRIDWKKFAPYVGVGYGRPLQMGSKWGFTTDLGVMFQGAGHATLTSNDCTAGTATCASLANDLQAESAKLNDKVDYRYWPVVRVGLYYHFD